MRIILGLAAAFALSACTFSQYAPVAPIYAVTASSPHILAALNDERRPAADRARDEFRHPAETLAFAQIGPGDRVADLLPGGGYFTRVFAMAVGPDGLVYPTIRPEGVAGQYETPILEVAAEYSNAFVARAPYDALAYPELLDVVFTAQNYHDMHIAEYNLGDPHGMNRTAFAALKPGGLYIIIDHAAVPGADAAEALAAHRINENQVRAEVEAAGFVFDGASDALRNPLDARTLNVFDPAIRGRTDQFMLRFRKPA
jgi:predicted methyltransferase